MKALVKFAKGREGMAIREVPVPEPAEGEIRLKIKAVGICGSDIHTMFDERVTAIPVILGHEFVGVVDKVNGDVGDFRVGDWATGIPACYNCGKCEYCQKGEVTICPDHKSVGVFKDGAMAEYMVMPAAFAFKIPEEIENKVQYALAEPLACCVRGVFERIDVKPGDVAVVSGPGAMGNMTAQALKARGAYVIISGLPSDRARLDLALELGADEAVESYEELKAAVERVRPGGADIACECVGVAPSLDTCLNILRIHGTALQIGIFPGKIQVDYNKMYEKELYCTATNSTATTTWATTLDLMNKGVLRVDKLISKELPLSEWEKGFDLAIAKTVYKVVLIP